MELLSEDEQWESLKRWLRTNGPSIVVMVVLALLTWFGWKWWEDRKDQQALQAAAAYQKVLAELDQGKLDTGLAALETMRKEFPGSGYIAVAELAAANVHVVNNELDKAAALLEKVATSADDALLRPIARLRLARVQTAQGHHDKALATLGTADMGSYQSAYLEVRGDVLLAKGDRAGALKAYEEARKALAGESAGEEGVGPMLDLKINDLKASAT